MNRIFFSVALFVSLALLISCSGMEQAAQESGEEEKVEVQQYPAWYADQNVVFDENFISGYATAVDTDSASSVSKAVSWAESELKSSVSSRLEDIRSEALKEADNGSGLDDPQFLIALRKAEEDVGPLVETTNTEVRSIKGYDTYRSFAEIQVPKSKLIERIGERLSGHEEAWNAMKASKAFQSF